MRARPGYPGLARGALLSLILAGAAMGTGCVTVPEPREQLAVAQSAINDAVRSGAREHAPAELRLAQDKLQRAHQLTRNKEHSEALQLAEQAAMDARLAEAKAASAKAQLAAREVERSLDTLRRELRYQDSRGPIQGGGQ